MLQRHRCTTKGCAEGTIGAKSPGTVASQSRKTFSGYRVLSVMLERQYRLAHCKHFLLLLLSGLKVPFARFMHNGSHGSLCRRAVQASLVLNIGSGKVLLLMGSRLHSVDH